MALATCVVFSVLFASLFLCDRTITGFKRNRTKSDRSERLESILNGYDPHLPPDYDSGTPVDVSVQIGVLSIDNINEASMDYSMTLYLRQMWADERLQYAPFNVTSSTGSSNGTDDQAYILKGHLELDTRSMDKVWVPDTFFYNERQATFHEVTVPNKLLHIFPNGTVFYSMRVSLTLTCQMLLTKYPFDHQHCPLRLGSYGYSSEILSYHWHTDLALQINKDMLLPTFTIADWGVQKCQNSEFEGLNLGRFSCLTLTVGLARSYGFYISQIYVPSVMIVILSWVSFWLDIEAIPARISLGLLTVLTMTTMSVGARSSLPRVSYLKALDVWNASCLVFVFAALLEFAYVNVTTRVEKRRMTMRDAVNFATKKDTKAPKVTTIDRQRARFIDKCARIGFPSSFFIFNIFYWCLYMI